MTSAISASGAKLHWATLREAGTLGGMRFLLWVHRCCGRGVFSLVLYPVMLYYLAFRPVARRASYDFLLTHYHINPAYWRRKPDLRDVFRHFLAFGQSVLDKLLGWSTPISETEFDIADEALLEEFLRTRRGQLIIGSHVGNLEYCRGFVQRYKNRTINILVYDRHAANFVDMMQQINPESRVHVYQVDQLDIPTVLSLKKKIDAGEWLFIAGDRVPLSGGGRTAAVSFMRRRAHLPIGPYMLAHTLRCPVKLMFSYRVGKKVFFELLPFAEQISLPRRGRDQALQHLAQQFAAELERQCLRAPLQWFNFYPFWAEPTAAEMKDGR